MTESPTEARPLRIVLRWIGTSIAALVLATGLVRPTQDAIANGDTRTLSLYNTHSKEALNVTFKRNGSYDPDALKKLNWFMRDWRRDEPTRMDPRLFDIVWAAYREVGGTQPIHFVSGYRAPETNAMLRRRSRGVAKFSQHTLGKAMDFFIPGVPTSAIRIAGLRLQRGGVGFYPTSNTPFVHLDAGSVRMWPRMTRAQLAQVFPDGKTVHVPSDGKKMPGYAQAYAEVMAGGGAVRGESAFVASSGGDDEDAGMSYAPQGGDNADSPLAVLLASQTKTKRPIPSQTFMTASADSEPATTAEAEPAPAPAPTQVAEAAPAEPAPSPEPDAAVPLPAAKPTELAAATPALVWQTGPDGQVAGVPMPPQRPQNETPAQVEEPAPIVVASAEPPPRPADDAEALPTNAASPSRSVFFAGTSVQASAAMDPIGALLPEARQKPAAQLAYAADPPKLRSTTAPEPSPSVLVSTRFESQNFAAVTNPEPAAQDLTVSELVTPDLGSVDGMIAKPERLIIMRFGLAAYQDLRAEKFSGRAIRALRTAAVADPAADITGSIASTE